MFAQTERKNIEEFEKAAGDPGQAQGVVGVRHGEGGGRYLNDMTSIYCIVRRSAV